MNKVHFDNTDLQSRKFEKIREIPPKQLDFSKFICYNF